MNKKLLIYLLAGATIPLDLCILHYSANMSWLRSCGFMAIMAMIFAVGGILLYMIFNPLFEEQERLHQERMKFYRERQNKK